MTDASKQTKDTKGDTVDLDAMSVSERVTYRYQHGQGSIQDIARWDRLSVDEVLTILHMDDLKTVQTQGDLVDSSELMPGTPVNHGDQFRVNYSND